MNYTSTLLNPGCNRGKWRYCSGFPTSLEDVMSSWWFFEVFASFRFWVVRYPSYQPSLTEPQSLTWHLKMPKLGKGERKIWPKPTSFFGVPAVSFGVCVCAESGKIFSSINIVAAWQRSFSQAAVSQLFTRLAQEIEDNLFFFSETWRSTGEMFEVRPLFIFFLILVELNGWLWGIFFCLFVFFVNKQADSMVMNDFL